MRTCLPIWCVVVFFALAIAAGRGEEPSATPLPVGVRAVWDSSKAFCETTPTRERTCLNGLWRWQPAREGALKVPTNQWGYFKVPGCWPGITDYLQKDSQILYAHSAWRAEALRDVTAAWYERTLVIPTNWAGRRITLQVEYLNSYAEVYVDGRKAGELMFPGGEMDITSACQPGTEQVLSLQVVALPLKAVMNSPVDLAAAKAVKGGVERRGLCGDVWLQSAPTARVEDVKVDTSVRKWEITFGAALRGLAAERSYALRARITRDGRDVVRFTSQPFRGGESQGRRSFMEKWKPDRLWDLHTPTNLYRLQLSLLDAAGKVLDTSFEERFGFREFWIQGRDFYLNGSRIFLCAVPLDNAQVGAAHATYEAVRESLARLKNFGINFVYTHNYGCEPGMHLSFAEALRAADDAGVLVALSQPHFTKYDWQSAEAEATNGYARHAEFYTRAAGNHPAVVFYAMSHNTTGYDEDMNPDLIDGIHEPRDQWSRRSANLALRAEAIVRKLDPGRIVYHHASGNLGAMHTVNFYANFAPIQEQSDWFEHWATEGVKPLFTCEYSVPFTWDWTMYRGWYQGKREWGSARVPWEFCLAEWSAQFLGDRAFRAGEAEKADLRWEANQYRAGKVWHRWDYPYEIGSKVFEQRYEIMALYLQDNWRAFRTWGVSGISPWEHEHYWKLREGVERRRQEFRVDWEQLQRPGFSPDFEDQRYERMDLAFERNDWMPTAAAQALLRNNQPLLAYIAGGPGAFTCKDHNYQPGDAVEKQLVVINNSRAPVSCRCDWSMALPVGIGGGKKVSVGTGEQARVPLQVTLPPGLVAGRYELSASFRFSNGETQRDTLMVDVLSVPTPRVAGKIALFDPKGETGRWLSGLGVAYESVDARADPAAYDVLIVGKAALTTNGAAPDISRVREGLKVLIFEQSAAVLEQRFGFRVAEQGLRWVFPRVPDHPVLAGLTPERLCNWRGSAMLVPPRLGYELRPMHGPTVEWCGLPVSRLWRCGNRGNVASVLIEKPARGDFLPLLEGGYSLQYSPLMEYREGRGRVWFCQMDVTGRTADDPAAETLARNLLGYSCAAAPLSAASQAVCYAGESAGKTYLERAGLAVSDYVAGSPASNRVLVVGPQAGGALAGAATSGWLQDGRGILALGADEATLEKILPEPLTLKRGEHISTIFEPFEAESFGAGVGPADVHIREPRELALVSGGAEIVGDGVLAKARGSNAVICQLAPWAFDYSQAYNLKRTYRRTSFLVARLLANLGAAGATPLLRRFSEPVTRAEAEPRWREGFYLEQPEEWDDPYRFFRW